MVLTIDIGNTNIVIGGYINDTLELVARINTEKNKTEDEYIVLIRDIIVSKAHTLDEIEGAIIVHNLEELFEELQNYNTDDVFVIGGESVYKQLLPYCKKCYLTKVYNSSVIGNKFFPNIDYWDTDSCTIMKDAIYDYTYSILTNPDL